MIHQPGAATRARTDFHLGQKPKLGGRYADDSLIYISYFVGPMYIHVSLFPAFLFLFPLFQNTKDQKYFHCFSLFAFLVCYLWFALLAIFGLLFEKSKNICFVCYFLLFLFQKSKTPKKNCCSSLVL
jgi:hypothetical protein